MGDILVIDDNPLNAELVDYVLSAAGMQVRCVGSAREGFAAIAQQRPDLLLMDIQMPEVDGLEMTRQLKQHPHMCTIPVVALTAYAMKGDEQRILAAGCDGYLRKPIDVKTFAESVRGFLRPA